MNYEIRKATKADEDRILSLGRKIVDKYERTHLGNEMADSFINSGMCDNTYIQFLDNTTLLSKDGCILGLAIVIKSEIQGFLIDIPYWGTGAANVLLEYATNTIFDEYEAVTLECFESSPRANAFYQKNGFIKLGVKDGDGGKRIQYCKYR